jgi:hypothetical protein
MQQGKRARLEKKGILILSKDDEKREIEFELDYLTSLRLQDRFVLMWEKSSELKTNLEKNGYRTAPAIIKRK